MMAAFSGGTELAVRTSVMKRIASEEGIWCFVDSDILNCFNYPDGIDGRDMV